MGNRREEGRASGPLSIEDARIAQLPPGVVLRGLNQLLSEEIVPFQDRAERTAADEWRLDALHAVSSVVNLASPLYTEVGKEGKVLAERGLRYAKFIDLEGVTAEGLQAASARGDIEDREGVIELFPLNRLSIGGIVAMGRLVSPERRMELRGEAAQRKSDLADLGVDLGAKDRSMLGLIDVYMRSGREKLPPYEEFAEGMHQLAAAIQKA